MHPLMCIPMYAVGEAAAAAIRYGFGDGIQVL
jgi:hypothetical protein